MEEAAQSSHDFFDWLAMGGVVATLGITLLTLLAALWAIRLMYRALQASKSVIEFGEVETFSNNDGFLNIQVDANVQFAGSSFMPAEMWLEVKHRRRPAVRYRAQNESEFVNQAFRTPRPIGLWFRVPIVSIDPDYPEDGELPITVCLKMKDGGERMQKLKAIIQ